MNLAFVLPYGELSDGFFPDTLLGILCAEARDAGHRAHLLRVYYDGRVADRDRDVAARLEDWLATRDVDLVVVERLFDPAPVMAHVARRAGRRCVLVSRGDSFDPIAGVEFVIGANPGLTRGGTTRRSPTLGELSASFRGFVAALATARDPMAVPGVARVRHDGVIEGLPPAPAEPLRPLRPVVEHDTIAAGPAPRIVRKTLLGNSGCPFADDPADNAHYAGLRVAEDQPLARLGCAFCSMGGDYQKRPDEVVVAELVEQAVHIAAHAPDVEELVLSDQQPLRYLPALLRAARAAGVRPMRWLFAARADSFVREEARITAAIAAAAETGQSLELYLSGFEAFCDRELVRYNKGTKVATLLAAVARMRALATLHPREFGYARARGHSLILWNPWTAPEDLGESVAAMRAHGLGELFHDIGRNRLRLYRDLPIFHAAERDGALAESWDGADAGAGRRKGYNVEHPWRFLDARTGVAYALATGLRDRLGGETELAQLAAVVEHAGARRAGRPEEVLAAFDTLDAAVLRLVGMREPGQPPRGAQERAAAVLFTGACNNGCVACPNREQWLDDGTAAVGARVDAARASGLPIVLAGREPTLHAAFLGAVRRARGDDGRAVGVVTNGRRFAYPAFAAASVAAGLAGASIKVFAPDAASADAIGRDPGGFEQACAGFQVLRAAGVPALELRAPFHRANLANAERWVALARAVGADQIRVEMAVDAIGLDGCQAAAAALDRLASTAAAAGMPLELTTMRAGTRGFELLVRAVS